MILQERGKQFTLTVPKRIVEELGWHKGDVLHIKVDGKNALRLIKE